MHLTQHKANYINVGNCQKSSSVSTKPTNMLHNLAVYCVDDGRKKRSTREIDWLTSNNMKDEKQTKKVVNVYLKWTL